MADDRTIAVEATDQRYFTLKHMPGRLPLDADGKGVWPADQFTFRLMQDGAIRRQEPAASDMPAASPISSIQSEPAAADAAAARKRS